ncbi:U3 small nucleolar ribonucleoprotein mpp10 [Leucoagaricus sp. SymC.cos]|nr:U3 small nucleolar ribonucleoprotein mpp10 [Leucoagaricus sp. SymC.cos]
MSAPEPLSVPHELERVTHKLDERIGELAHGSEDIQNTALLAAKYVFELSLETERGSKISIDDLLASLNPLQKPQTRSQARAVGPSEVVPTKSFEPTPISALCIENMDPEQVWMQLDLRAQTLCDLLAFALETGKSEEELTGEEDEDEDEDEVEEDDRLQKLIEALNNGEEVEFGDLEEDLEEDSGIEDNGRVESDESEDEAVDVGDNEEDIIRLQPFDEDNSDPEVKNTSLDAIKSGNRSKKKKGANHELDDDFFNLDAFNAETERAEAKFSSRGRLAEDSDDSEEDNMSVDFFALLDENEAEAEGATKVFYRDFFAPPRTQGRPRGGTKSSGQGRVRFHDEVRVKKIEPKGKNLPLNLMYGMDVPIGDSDNDSDDEKVSEDENTSQGHSLEKDDHRATIERLKDDLFADDDDINDRIDMTVHEKRQAALRGQIAQLEAENVAKKDWTLMGEADSRSRPQNSLLEEDLEFERVMKPTPVISEEVVQGLEQRIKARILKNQFDDVVRIRPLEDKPFLPSRIVELQDTKSTQSLAQIYETGYLASQSGVMDDRDGKLKKEHEEIEQQWENICSKLDALCNAHFVPKQPKAMISTVSNVASASMESALPTAKATSSVLAPEEIFTPASAETRSRAELTPAEKRALRTKVRKVKKKQRETLEKNVDKVAKVSKGISRVKKEKQTALQNIVKSGKGVTVVGKQAKGLGPAKKR